MSQQDQNLSVPSDHEDSLYLSVEQFFKPRKSEPTTRDIDFLSKGQNLALKCGLAATAWGDGPPVLLAHGWESRRSHWSAIVPMLVESGYRVIAMDAPAHGDSPGDQVSVVQYALSINNIGRELGHLEGIIGHSFGGAAATIACRNGLQTHCAILISAPSSISTLCINWAIKYGVSPSDIPRFLELVSQKVGVHVDHMDISLVASELSHPALVIHDQGDDEIPLSEGLAIAAAWKDSKLFVTKRYGHRRILIAKDVIRESIQFMNQCKSMN